MNIIFLSEEYKNARLCAEFLSENFSVTLVSEEKAESFGRGEKLYIICSQKIIMEELHNSVVVLTSSTIKKQPELLGRNNILILPADFKYISPATAYKQEEIITYGFSEKSTVTFSSMDEETAMISLQRNIKTADGRTVEPLDFPIRNNASKSVLLYSACLKLILRM